MTSPTMAIHHLFRQAGFHTEPMDIDAYKLRKECNFGIADIFVPLDSFNLEMARRIGPHVAEDYIMFDPVRQGFYYRVKSDKP
jgi:hypothetical protein